MSAGRIFIKPTKGLLVRNPFTKKLVKTEGEATIDNIYWRRLEKQGDITIEKEAPEVIYAKDTKKSEAKK